MKVKSLMTRVVTSCEPQSTLEEAGRTMRSIDSGVLPVLDHGQVAGVITDRDICIALTEHDRRGSEVRVAEVMSRGAWTCSETDSVRKALATMRAKRVRRLPVLDSNGGLAGILSINDVLRHAAKTGDGPGVSSEEALETLQRIGEHRYPAAPAPPADVTELARSF